MNAISKILLLFLIIICNSNIFAQKQLSEKDWIGILSGNIDSYKNLNIKTITLTNKGEIINKMEYLPPDKVLKVKNITGDYEYLFDNKNEVLKVSNIYRVHSLFYENEKIKSYQISFDDEQNFVRRTISKPYKNSNIEWFVSNIIRKSDGISLSNSSSKTILNPADSLWSYNEIRNNEEYYRTYFNKIKTKYYITNNKSSHYDSIYTNNKGKLFSFHKYILRDEMSKTIKKNDSVLEYNYEKGKLFHTKISNSVGLLRETFYDKKTEILSKTVAYFYYPEENTMQPILWKTLEYIAKNKETNALIPLKKSYKLENNIIVRRKKFRFWKKKMQQFYIANTSDYIEYKSRKLEFNNLIYDVSSTSILIDTRRLTANLDGMEFDDYWNSEKVHQVYIHSEFPNSDISKTKFSGFYKTGDLPQEVKNEIIRTQKKVDVWSKRSGDWKVEVTTYDGKIYSCDPYLIIEKVNLNVDYFIYE